MKRGGGERASSLSFGMCMLENFSSKNIYYDTMYLLYALKVFVAILCTCPFASKTYFSSEVTLLQILIFHIRLSLNFIAMKHVYTLHFTFYYYYIIFYANVQFVLNKYKIKFNEIKQKLLYNIDSNITCDIVDTKLEYFITST